MKKIILALGLIGFLAFAPMAMAVPTLQLWVEDGVLPVGQQTLFTDRDDPFTLYALLTTDDLVELSWDYYVSIAVVVPTDPENAADDHGDISVPYLDTGYDLGTISFEQDGAVEDYIVTADMEYGTPPVVGDDDDPDETIPPHNVFETYFAEYPVIESYWDTPSGDEPFISDGTFIVQEIAEAMDGDSDEGGKTTYYIPFFVDATGLSDDYELHFDLYYLIDGDLETFAGLSMDVQTYGGGTTQVPEPGSLLLLGVGIVGLAGVSRKLS